MFLSHISNVLMVASPRAAHAAELVKFCVWVVRGWLGWLFVCCFGKIASVFASRKKMAGSQPKRYKQFLEPGSQDQIPRCTQWRYSTGQGGSTQGQDMNAVMPVESSVTLECPEEGSVQ